jgi:HSP20 family molecular chaperone IbpA
MARRRDLDRLEEIEELFADLWQVPRFAAGMRYAFRPQLDVCRSGDKLTVVVEIPGADPDAIRVILDGRRLLVAGERPRPRGSDDVWYRSEIEYGPFEREVALAVDVSVDDAEATYERGLLKLVLPIAPQPQETERVAIVVRRTA